MSFDPYPSYEVHLISTADQEFLAVLAGLPGGTDSCTDCGSGIGLIGHGSWESYAVLFGASDVVKAVCADCLAPAVFG